MFYLNHFLVEWALLVLVVGNTKSDRLVLKRLREKKTIRSKQSLQKR